MRPLLPAVLVLQLLVACGSSSSTVVDGSLPTGALSPDALRTALLSADDIAMGEVATDDTGTTWAKLEGIPMFSIPSDLADLPCTAIPELPGSWIPGEPATEERLVESRWLYFDGNPAAVLALSETPWVWAWRAEESCWANWTLHEHPAVGEPALQMELLIETTEEGIVRPDELPISTSADLSAGHPGEETVQLGEYGFTVDSAAGERLVGFLPEAEITEGTELYEDTTWGNLTIRTRLEAFPASTGGVLFRLTSAEDALNEHTYSSAIDHLLYWDGISVATVELSRDEVLTSDVMLMGWSEESTESTGNTYFATDAGRFLLWWRYEEALESYDCVEAAADAAEMFDEDEFPDDLLGPDDPCCHFSATHTYWDAGWDFHPIGVLPTELLYFEPHDVTAYEPVDCADEGEMD